MKIEHRKDGNHYFDMNSDGDSKYDEPIIAIKNERNLIPLEEFTVIIHETPEDKIVNDEAEKEE